MYRRLFELRESLNVLSDINFHLNICMNIQFHRYIHLKYQFVCKLMKKSLWKIWTDLDLKVGCIKKQDKLDPLCYCQTKIYERSLEMTFVDETTN